MDDATFQQQLLALKQEFPSLRTTTFGRSLLGRPLYALRFGKGQRHLLLAGAFHGMEHLTTSLLLRYSRSLIGELLPCRVTIIPMVNPDGVAIQTGGWQKAGRFGALVQKISHGDTTHWQANGRGVDLNHNFDAGWQDLHRREQESGITGPGPTRFGGLYPESEPETQALCQLCRKEQFSLAIAFHSQGEEIYWEYGPYTPDISLQIAREMAKRSGYALEKPQGLAVGGGMKDWFICAFHRPAFTVEVGKGKNPLPEQALEEIYPKMKNMLDALLCKTP